MDPAPSDYDAEADKRADYTALPERGQLGFPLDQVDAVLAEPEWQLAPAIERHLADARHQQDSPLPAGRGSRLTALPGSAKYGRAIR